MSKCSGYTRCYTASTLRDSAMRPLPPTQHSPHGVLSDDRRQRKERLLEQLQQQRAKKLEEANQRIGDAQQQLGGLDAARSQQSKQVKSVEE